MLEIVLLCAIGCLFFMVASVRFKKQLAKQEEEMANLRATRRQQARDRELAIEEFLNLQEKWRLDLIQEHFEFHTIPARKDDVSAGGSKEIKESDKIDKLESPEDRDKTDATLSSSSYDETDDDEENQQQQQQQQQRKDRSNTETTIATSGSSDTTEPSLESSSKEDSPEQLPQSASAATSDSNDANQNNTTTGTFFSSWLTSFYRPHHQSQQSKDEEDDHCCCICLETYKSNDTVCRAKNSACHHMFHKECALQWFMGSLNHNECPMCRITVLPNALDFDDDLICLRVPSNPRRLGGGGGGGGEVTNDSNARDAGGNEGDLEAQATTTTTQ